MLDNPFNNFDKNLYNNPNNLDYILTANKKDAYLNNDNNNINNHKIIFNGKANKTLRISLNIYEESDSEINSIKKEIT